MATGIWMPRSSHLRSCRHAARTTQALMSRIRPLSSAISTKRVGEMSPYSSSRQRSSASTPTSWLFARPELRLEHQRQQIVVNRAAQLALRAPANRAGGCSSPACRRRRVRGAGLRLIHRRVGVLEHRRDVGAVVRVTRPCRCSAPSRTRASRRRWASRTLRCTPPRSACRRRAPARAAARRRTRRRRSARPRALGCSRLKPDSALVSRSATVRSTASPIAWPNVSLTRLKLFRSR